MPFFIQVGIRYEYSKSTSKNNQQIRPHLPNPHQKGMRRKRKTHCQEGLEVELLEEPDSISGSFFPIFVAPLRYATFM